MDNRAVGVGSCCVCEDEVAHAGENVSGPGHAEKSRARPASRNVSGRGLVRRCGELAAKLRHHLPRWIGGRRVGTEAAPVERLHDSDDGPEKRCANRDESELALLCEQLEGRNRNLEAQLRSREHYAAALREELMARTCEPQGAVPKAEDAESKRRLDQFYVAFEDRFRGSRELIRERVAVHLPYVRASAAASELTVDLGCGRGEWLEVLRENGFRARGVDSNLVMIEMCRERGLDVVSADALTFLRSLPDASVGAVTGFHIVEHLPFEVLLQFLFESQRVLKSGGMAIFETPNPRNIQVAACNFYLDPTHRNPVPSQLLKYLLEACGLCRVEILELHPEPGRLIRDHSEVAGRFNELFCGPQDYAAIAWKA